MKVLKFLAASFLVVLVSVSSFAANPFLKNKEVVLSGSAEDDNSKAVMIVMDASGSMSEPAPGSATKMLMAKNVLEQVLSKIDSSIPVGLRVYGSSKTTPDPVIACQDSILLVPPGVGNRGQMINKLREVKPTGATPISYSLKKAVEDLDQIDAKNKSVVLISDGLETCAYDPCLLARSMKARGVNVQFNVVGFNVNNDFQARSQLECIAKSTDGKFYTADTAAELSEGLLDGINYTSPSINSVKGQIKELNKDSTKK
ncbi:MAG: VWA domain-containing protein [Candidatus Caenarcaniphilales bacterium]|nr:VWA domain-containing protein [Candidatus Caenarcaniphilales bacterium]